MHSTRLFRKAAGVYTYLAEEVLNHIVGTQEKPPEAMSPVSSVMSLICLAEAQVYPNIILYLCLFDHLCL